MRLLSLFVTVTALMAACGQDYGPTDIVVTPSILDFGVVDPADGPVTRLVRIENLGGDSGTMLLTGVVTNDATCGTFSIPKEDPWAVIKGRSFIEYPVTFTPSSGAEAGCNCHATGHFEMMFDGETGDVEIGVIAAGECDQPLRCTPTAVAFDDGVAEHIQTRTVQCFNLSAVPVTVSRAKIEGGDGQFSVRSNDMNLPATIGQGDVIAIEVIYTPPEPGSATAVMYLYATPDGGNEAEFAFAVQGQAERRFPLCSEGIPSAPEVSWTGPGYVIIPELNHASQFTGTVRSRWFYDDEPPMTGDVLLASGALALPNCEAGQDGHMAYWKNCNPAPTDLFANIHAIPADDLVRRWISSIDVWDNLTIVGWEVLKIEYDLGYQWADAGCHTTIITWVCED